METWIAEQCSSIWDLWVWMMLWASFSSAALKSESRMIERPLWREAINGWSLFRLAAAIAGVHLIITCVRLAVGG